MKIILLTLFMTARAFANCNYYSENDSVSYIGYNLNYSTAMTKLMSQAGFKRNFQNDYDYEFVTEVRELDTSPFKKAYASIRVVKDGEDYFYIERSSLCLTQSCTVSSVANNLNKLFVKAKKKIKSCQ